MNVCILCVGKLKELFFSQACAEYLKRLSRMGKVQVIEVPDEREPAQTSPAALRSVMDAEAARLLRHIRPEDHVITMEIGARQYASEAFAQRLETLCAQKRVCFVIGGSFGLGQAILDRSDEAISLSKMTFPHQLARVVLLEQIYRAAKISSGERYHK